MHDDVRIDIAEIKTMLGVHGEALQAILAQTKATNGRVGSLERDRSLFRGLFYACCGVATFLGFFFKDDLSAIMRVSTAEKENTVAHEQIFEELKKAHADKTP